MEDSMVSVMFLLVCSVGHCLTQDDEACKISPFVDKRAHSSFLGKSKHIVNGLCVEEHAKQPLTPKCLKYTTDPHPPRFVDSSLATSSKPTLVTKGENKSKVDDVRGPAKKPVGVNKKLKGSKRQRKRNKKKKMGKKKKKS
ncbi:unnamed protein product [Lymnaea stagnalis]|uniref:Secreted protein n=1 Tax=Lymnaea stagnalis TaxID=6523 RepID=A0AAV2H3A8_LYMST